MPNEEKSREKREKRHIIKLVKLDGVPKRVYDKPEDKKRRKRQKENYAKKQAEKGIKVKRNKIYNEKNDISIFKLSFN